jgi:hypothetical protein
MGETLECHYMLPKLTTSQFPLCRAKTFRNCSSNSHNWLDFFWPRSRSIIILFLISTHMSFPLDGALDATLLGVCTLWWPYMDNTMIVFPVFLRYKNINKIKFIEIMEKRNFEFCPHFLSHLQNSLIWTFILQCVMCLKLWDIGWIMF